MNAVAEQVRCETLAAFEGTEDEVLLETPCPVRCSPATPGCTFRWWSLPPAARAGRSCE